MLSRIVSNWLHQFWLFAFKTAKHWGKGPTDWTAEILHFDEYHCRRTIVDSNPTTPGDMATPASHSSSRSHERHVPGVSVPAEPPSLCRWSIHCKSIDYEIIPSPPNSTLQPFDIENEQTWPDWPMELEDQRFPEKLCSNLENNDFSNIPPGDLPIDNRQVAEAARRSPDEMLKESFGFCIMSRNEDLLLRLLKKSQDKLRKMDFHPFHLAASFLDGSKACCGIFELLSGFLPIRTWFVNDMGHTIFDQLMLTILKAHSSCSPSFASDVFNKSKQYEGEEVDACGQWDADSDCIRQRLATGIPGVPFEWKHMFCHTSAQTICHCIELTFDPGAGADVNAESGLFTKRCMQCGLKLQLLPLHSLLMVGYLLSSFGCEGETLFGIIACLLSLLSYGSDPRLEANVSLDFILSDDESMECNHQKMDPGMFAEQVFTTFRKSWPTMLLDSWQVIIQILKRSQAARRPQSSFSRTSQEEWDGDQGVDEGEEPETISHEDPLLPCRWCEDYEKYQPDKILASLRAAAQIELLTYRRLKEGDPWISTNFNIASLAQGLTYGNEVAIALVTDGMMKPFCYHCGNFSDAVPGCVTIDDAAAYYFSNMDDWSQSTFRHVDEDRFIF